MKEATTRGASRFYLALVLIMISLGIVTLYNSIKPRHSDRNTRSRIAATALESAVDNFRIEYAKLPEVASTVRTDGEAGIALLEILLGLEKSSGKIQNYRGIKLLSVREGKNKSGGLIYSESGNTVEGLYDSWGNPYILEFDTDQDEFLELKFGSRIVKLKGRRVAVHSAGLDRKSGTSDDVTTW